MKRSRKQTLFTVTFWGAAALYLWALFIFWMAPEWKLSGWSYSLLGVLPALGGVLSLATAIALYVDLHEGGE